MKHQHLNQKKPPIHKHHPIRLPQRKQKLFSLVRGTPLISSPLKFENKKLVNFVRFVNFVKFIRRRTLAFFNILQLMCRRITDCNLKIGKFCEDFTF